MFGNAGNLFRQLIKSWYAVDRIRIRPAEGRLLSLQPGDRFLFNEQLFDVLGRKMKVHAGESRLDYAIRSCDGAALLQVAVGRDLSGLTSAKMYTDNGVTNLIDSDLIVLDSRETDGETPSVFAS